MLSAYHQPSCKASDLLSETPIHGLLVRIETKLRLMCAVRTAVARAFDAKLVVGLGGRCCNKLRTACTIYTCAVHPGTAAGMGGCPICRTACMLPVARPCRTAPSPPPGAGAGHIVGRAGRKEGRATMPACWRAASAHAPPSAPTCARARARAPACMRACMPVDGFEEVLVCGYYSGQH